METEKTLIDFSKICQGVIDGNVNQETFEIALKFSALRRDGRISIPNNENQIPKPLDPETRYQIIRNGYTNGTVTTQEFLVAKNLAVRRGVS